MLSEYTDVRVLFNQAAQDSGRQPRALANSLLMYAKNIDSPENLQDLVDLVTHKHASLQILPEQYIIVGTCLLRAIKEVLGDEVATDDVMEAWKNAYFALADLLTQKEETLYHETEMAEGVVSNYLHDEVKIGDRFRVYPPFGVFTLQEPSRPIALISAGVGITPMIPLLEEALTIDQPVYFIHAAQNHGVDPFYDWLHAKAAEHPNLTIFSSLASHILWQR